MEMVSPTPAGRFLGRRQPLVCDGHGVLVYCLLVVTIVSTRDDEPTKATPELRARGVRLTENAPCKTVDRECRIVSSRTDRFSRPFTFSRNVPTFGKVQTLPSSFLSEKSKPYLRRFWHTHSRRLIICLCFTVYSRYPGCAPGNTVAVGCLLRSFPKRGTQDVIFDFEQRIGET